MLKKEYEEKIKQKIKKELGVKSVHEVPTLTKIVINIGVGKNRENKAFLKEVEDDFSNICGQKPSKRKAKVSISNFRLRKGQLAGYSVTLREDKMWDFYEKLVKIALPRVKDFQGVSDKSLDGSGNYSIGLKEHTVFPEVDANKITYIKSFEITINTSAKTDEKARLLLSELGMPFRKADK